MGEIKFKGEEVNTNGDLPGIGMHLKDFYLLSTDLKVKTRADYKNKRLVLNIFPSLDTNTCAKSVREFNKRASELDNTVILNISRDLPFAQKRFCAAENIDNVEVLSDFDTAQFARDNGLLMTDGKLKGLCSRCIIVTNKEHEIIYIEHVEEITDEPDYENVMTVLT